MTANLNQFGSAGCQFLIEKEGGMRLHLYYDSAHLPTIGVGHLMSDAEVKDYYQHPEKWNEDYLWQLFETDQARFISYVDQETQGVNLTSNQDAALVSWSFNSGCPAQSDIWTGLHKDPVDYVLALNTLCQYTGIGRKGVAKGLQRWIPLYPGLMNRRFDETVLFLRDMDLAQVQEIFFQLCFKDGSKLRRINPWGGTSVWLADMAASRLRQFLNIVTANDD